jgi:hypothetical protein
VQPDRTATKVKATKPPAEAWDRERLEREREGGGAPSERTGRQYATVMAKIWRALFHPGDLQVLWRRVALQNP